MASRRKAAAILTLVITATAPSAARGATGARYYVDCARGNDAASGLAPSTAWRTLARASAQPFNPGDLVLFRRGTVCHGSFAPTRSGSPGRPITAGAFGRGAKPVLAGDGARATIALHGVEHWELRDLTVTDEGPPPAPGDKRTAISVAAGRVIGHHYVLENLTVRDVNTSPVAAPGNTDLENWSKDTGGIVFESGGPGFADVQIVQNRLVNVDREGIYVNGPAADVTIARNRLRDIGGDGIVTDSATGALVERNVVDGFNTLGTSFNAGIWGYASTDGVFQLNDVSHGMHGPLDSMAYDVDGSNHRLLFQYNLSHDNSGGFLMLCNNVAPLSAGAPNGGTIVRFNISQNDYAIGRGVIDAPFACGTENDIWIYNNTVFTRDARASTLVENTANSSLHVLDNIFVGAPGSATIFDRSGTWSSNLYDLVACVARPADARALIADPQLTAPGTATTRDGASGYRLRAGSPALGAGVPIADNGDRDYFGNPIPATHPNIGAYQGPGIETGPPGPALPAIAPGC